MACIGTVKVKFDDEQQEKLVNLCMKYKAENEKLREEIEQWERLTKGVELPDYPITEFQPKDVERENAKLRELITDMWRFTGTACKKYPRLFDPAAQGGQMVQPNSIDLFEQRIRELGIGTDK